MLRRLCRSRSAPAAAVAIVTVTVIVIVVVVVAFSSFYVEFSRSVRSVCLGVLCSRVSC